MFDECPEVKPFFSVVIPAYNCQEWIYDTLRSAFNQNFKDFEIIIVNDGSSDDTRVILEGIPKNRNIRILHQSNQGEGAARNAGIFAARGQYLAFLDHDDLWFPWTLETCFSVINQAKMPVLLLTTGMMFDQQRDLSAVTLNAIKCEKFPCFFATGPTSIPTATHVTVVRRDIAIGVGGLSEDRVIGIDQEFLWKFGNMAEVVHLRSPITVAIRRHRANLSGNIKMTVAGISLFIAREQSGSYPGGTAFAYARQCIIGSKARTISINALKSGAAADAFALYRSVLRWNIHQWRLKYLLGFPLLYIYYRSAALMEAAK